MSRTNSFHNENPNESKESECCSAFFSRFYGVTKCCCKWTSDGSTFPAYYTTKFRQGAEDIWTCNKCSNGFKC